MVKIGVRRGKYSALEVAKYIIEYCVDNNQPIVHIKLQHLLYLSQLHFIKEHGRLLFSDDIEAWKYGPCVQKVYSFFVGYASAKIKNYYWVDLAKYRIDYNDRREIDEIIEANRNKSAWCLVCGCFNENKPWKQTYDNGNGLYGIIKPELMMEGTR